MRPSEAAKIIGCGKRHVCRLIEAGTLKARRVPSQDCKHGYRYEVSQKEAERYRDIPQGRGYPRGRKRK